MEREILVFKLIAIVALCILAIWLIRKLVEATFNIITIMKVAKNKNHKANAESVEVICNEKTKKLENCNNVIKLPFN